MYMLIHYSFIHCDGNLAKISRTDPAHNLRVARSR
jgi:hypothetical protein